MTHDVAYTVSSFRCPACSRLIKQESDGPAACFCGWKGQAMIFAPLTPMTDGASNALAEDATCVHHPTKKAVAVCEGSGDYICSLCSIDLDGKTYSAQYLERAGKDKITQAFDRYLARPDRGLINLIGLSFFFLPAALVAVPFGVYYFVKMVKQRKRDSIYRRLIGRGRVVGAALLLALVTVPFLILIVVLIAKA